MRNRNSIVPAALILLMLPGITDLIDSAGKLTGILGAERQRGLTIVVASGGCGCEARPKRLELGDRLQDVTFTVASEPHCRGR